MNHLQSLGDYFVNNGISRQKIESWAEDGDLIFSPSGEQGYTLRYVARFEMSNVKVQPHKLFGLVVSWIQKYNSERESEGLPAPQFFNEPLEGGQHDLGIRIEFIEQFQFESDSEGEWEVDGQRVSLVSNFKPEVELSDLSYLAVIDSHTQDMEMTD